MSKIAIMQPYLFPYLGYFQLINLVDIFVFYDDVKYTKSHWYNRNYISENGERSLFTFPVLRNSTADLIKDIFYSDKLSFYKNKLKKRLKFNYKNNLNIIYELIDYNKNNLANYNINAIINISRSLNFTTLFFRSSELSLTTVGRYERIFEICRHFNCNYYVNSIGGKNLYDKNKFYDYGLEIELLDCKIDQPFSIIHEIMMFNTSDLIKRVSCEYELFK
ncbi:WbqC family protein [Piscirickettsia salmonis]|uniref:WbqC family protein n=1 Tax=Piscirickettsia salmonis TaxID=1238 RepID=UPI0007C98E53|nr:WbqC-like protein family protein [Piscirickettsiaceae bacterium NZ-RLO1]